MKCFILQHVSVINFQNLYCTCNIWNPQIQAFQGDIFLGQKLKEIQSLLFSCVRQHPTLSTSQNHKKPPLTLCSPSQQALISACMQMPSARGTYQSQIIFHWNTQKPHHAVTMHEIGDSTYTDKCKRPADAKHCKGKKCYFKSIVFVSLFSLNINKIKWLPCEQRFLCMAFIVYKVVCMITCLSCIVALFMPNEDRNQLHESY